MGHFQGRLGAGRPKARLHAIGTMLWAVQQAFRRASHILKGRKRLYASALAFKTVLALVPALAVLMAVLSHDAFKEQRERILGKMVDLVYPVDARMMGPWPPSSEIGALQRLNEEGKAQLRQAVERSAGQARKMGWAGLGAFALVLFYLMRDVEDSFNFLWGIGKGRHLLAQSAFFLGILFGIPLLAALLLGLMTWVGQWVEFRVRLGWVPILLGLWIACAAAYKVIPHTRVRWGPAAWGGLLAALLLTGARAGAGWYAQHSLEASRVYGALWMFPVILMWFYLFWTMVLFGAETAYFTQTGREVERDPEA